MTETKKIVFEGEIFNLSATEAKIEQINKRAAAKGLEGGFTYTVESKATTNAYGFKQTKYFLVVEGSAPKANGWTLLAKVTWEGETPVVDMVPGYEGPLVDRSTLDGHCDICGYDRQRNHVIICESETEGRKVVGGQCVKDLLGHDLSGTLWPLPKDGDDDGWGLGSGGGYYTVNTEQVVCAAIAATTVWGWVSRSNAAFGEKPTADYVEDEIIGRGWSYFAALPGAASVQYGEAMSVSYTDLTKATAKKVIEWAKSLPPTSEFNQNLVACASAEQVDPKRIGILSYAFTGWLKAEERKAAAAAEAEILVNEPLAEPKTRVKDVPATITGVKFVESMYGTSTLVKFLTDSGHKAAWFASNTEINQSWIGRKVKVTGTVKKVGEWQGVIETSLTRCVVVAA